MVTPQEAQAQAILQQTQVKAQSLIHRSHTVDFKKKTKKKSDLVHDEVFLFQLSLKGPPGPLGLTGRPGPQVRRSPDL